MGDGLTDPGGHVHQYAGEVLDASVHHGERNVAAEFGDGAVAQSGGDEQSAVDLFGHGTDEFFLDPGLFVGVGDEDVVVADTCLCLRRFYQGREEGVGDIGDDEFQIAGTPGGQRPGGPVGAITELVR